MCRLTWTERWIQKRSVLKERWAWDWAETRGALCLSLLTGWRLAENVATEITRAVNNTVHSLVGVHELDLASPRGRQQGEALRLTISKCERLSIMSISLNFLFLPSCATFLSCAFATKCTQVLCRCGRWSGVSQKSEEMRQRAIETVLKTVVGKGSISGFEIRLVIEYATVTKHSQYY